jgi:lipopolysaccharide/colanic/teichoic acid biosynthesis glycosyltransferase
MSLIGPRPLSVDETNHIANTLKLPSDYPGFLPKVRPGLVGLEQINRHRELTYLERFGYNEEYESGWSMSCDAQIFTRGLLVCKEVCLVSLLGASLIGVLASLFFV